jgi:hypothetical protein
MVTLSMRPRRTFDGLDKAKKADHNRTHGSTHCRYPRTRSLHPRGDRQWALATAEDAAREALHLWEERQRRRTELRIELDAAEASFARGESRRVGPESITEFIAGVKRRGRTRLNNPR